MNKQIEIVALGKNKIELKEHHFTTLEIMFLLKNRLF